MKRVISIICMVGLIQTIWRQSLQIRGVIFEKTGKDPIEFANVILNRAADSTFVTGTTTDPRGRFSIPNLYKEDYYMLVSCMGYESVVVAVGDLQKNMDMGVIGLDSVSVMLDEVVIASSRVIPKIDRPILFLTDIHSDSDGKKYSIIGEGIYEKEMKVGRLSTGLKHTPSITNNDYWANHVKSETSFKYFSNTKASYKAINN